MKTTTVSIIMPCFNSGEYLEEAINSALAQTFDGFEILVVDDGSSDSHTRRLLDACKWPRTRVLRLPHQGVVAARNAGIADTSGEYICFLDADDRMDPRFLEKLLEPLEADREIAFASPWIRLFGDEQWDWKPQRCDLPALLHECCVATPALVRRNVVLEVGGFDPRLELGHEDWDLWLSIVARGHRGIIVPDVLFYYRRRARSRSAAADELGTYQDLYRERIAKYEASYREHLFDVLWLKDALLSPSLAQVSELEDEVRRLRREVSGELDAARERHSKGSQGTESASGEIQRENMALRETVTELEAEVRGLRRSHSWQVTAPLRHAYDWLLRRKIR